MAHGSEHLCHTCGKPMRAVQTHHRDRTTVDDECGNPACPDGPGGLMTLRQWNKETGEVIKRTKFWDEDTADEMVKGRPSQNEENVEAVAKAFIEAANRQFQTAYDRFDPGPKHSRDEAGYDCKIVATGGKYCLKLQVTRALSREIYWEQAKNDKREQRMTIAESVDWIHQAVENKASRASPCIALVIDGLDVPAIGIFADGAAVARHEETFEAQGWHSIWVIGHFGLRHLGGNCELKPKKV